MKIKKIICFGDSITGTCVTGYDYYNGLKFYPYLLGEYFDCEIENYGRGSNSNERIGVDILNVLHRENIDDSFFVINWTSAIRRLVYMEDRASLKNIGDATESRPWYKSSLIDSYATLKTMIMVQSLLDKMNIPYLNFFGWKSDFYLDNFSINWIGKHYIKYGKAIEWGHGLGERKIDSVNLYNYKSNMWSNAIPASPFDFESSEKHTFDFIYYLTNHLNMESFIHTEFYNFLVNKGTKRGTFSPIFKKNIKIPVLNDKILVISGEDLHPNELGHKLWTEEMLIPHIEERLVL